MPRNDIGQEPEKKVPDPEKENAEGTEHDAEHPVPGVEHHREPDAENIMPAEDGPGTL